MSKEPVAVIGMACRLPGGLESPDTLWSALLAGRDLVSDIPIDRRPAGEPFSPARRRGAFLKGIAGFDAEFFGISPREAVRMDPQQRLLLEVGYEALEDAGLGLEQVAGTDTGVYVGQIDSDYWTLEARDPQRLDVHSMTGAWARSAMSGRMSFAFDLRGPNLAVDTACSSSLAAVELAVRHVRSGGHLALAAGVNLVLLSENDDVYAGASLLSADRRCKFGDASADGYVRGEAVGVVVLKPLARAVADGDRIRAVLRGAATGSDGGAGGLMVRPAVEGQWPVVQAAYRDAGVDPADVDYVEAHGTGTRAGDPVELEVLGGVLGVGRPSDRPLLVGSIKTNTGHSEAAAGIVGLIKTVLCLEHGTVPASLHLRHPNPEIPWDTLPLEVVRTTTKLPDRGRPLLAGVSSFGFCGANAHVVLSAADPRASTGPDRAPVDEDRAEPLILSAASPEALRALAASWVEYLQDGGQGRDRSLADLCHSAALRRSRLPYRLAATVTSQESALVALRGHLDGQELTGVAVGESGEPPAVAFVYPGQGSQWIGMGRELLAGEPVFAQALTACDLAVRAETGWSVLEVLNSEAKDALARAEIVQPVLWAMQVALTALWDSWGVRPDVVIGHSMGEVAAACAAGSLSIAEGAAVICRRSRLASGVSGRGAMLWCELTADQAEEAVAPYEGSVVVAARNGPRSTIVSGDAADVGRLLGDLELRDVFARLIDVDFASHCPQMDEIQDDLLDALEMISPRPGTVPVRSTLLGGVVDGSVMDAVYWARNIREPVGFHDAIRDQLASSDTVFLEVSPHPVLTSAIREAGVEAGADPVRVLGSLRRDLPQRAALIDAVGNLHVAGVSIDWARVCAPGRYVPLPGYPWQHTPYWLPQAPVGDMAALRPGTAESRVRHPLLGSEDPPGAQGIRSWRGVLDLGRNAYLNDHRIQGAVIVPGTAYLELMTAAAEEMFGPTALRINDIHYQEALFVGSDEVTLRVTGEPEGDAVRFVVHSRTSAETEWTLHVRGSARADRNTEGPSMRGTGGENPDERFEPQELAALLARCPARQLGEEFYRHHAARGNQWEGVFQAVREVRRGEGEAVSYLEVPPGLVGQLAGTFFHPALLDACGHSLAAARPDVVAGQDAVFVLGGVDSYRWLRSPGAGLWSHARLVPTLRADSFAGDVRVYDADGLVAVIEGLRLQYLNGLTPQPLAQPVVDLPELSEEERMSATRAQSTTIDAGSAADSPTDWLHHTKWVAGGDIHPEPIAAGGTWLVLQDSGPVGRAVTAGLRGRGDRVVVITTAVDFEATDHDRYRADPGNPEGLATVVKEILSKGPLHGIVHLWSLDATASDDPSDSEVERARVLGCLSAVHLTAILEAAAPAAPPRWWLVTRGTQRVDVQDTVPSPFQAPLWGLGESLAAEHPAWRTTLVDLDEHAADVDGLLRELLQPDQEDRIALRGGRRHLARLVRGTPRTPERVTPVRLGQTLPGILDGLDLLPLELAPPGPHEVRIRVSHAALNYRDVLMASGMYPGLEHAEVLPMGWECAGTVEAVGAAVTRITVGQQVVAMAESSLASHVLAHETLVVPRPARLTAAQAVTIPAAFMTAYYALYVLGRIAPGERVLVHSASGGVGLAAIQVAHWHGARVYGTAGSERKRSALRQLGVEDVADSRTLGFAEQFRTSTDGHGFDLLLNTLPGEALAANLSLMAPYGRYLELAKRDIVQNTELGMGVFAENVSFSGIDLVHMVQHAPEMAGDLLRTVFDLVERGTFTPLQHQEFPADQTREAFRHMARSHHIGKVVVALPEVRPVAPTQLRPIPRRASAPGASTSLITGGLGGIGVELARHLIERGARQLLLTGRTPLPDDPATEPTRQRARMLADLRSTGADIEYRAVDATDAEALTVILADRRRRGMAPVLDAYHLAGIIDYCPVADLRPESLAEALRAKVGGAWALHRALRNEPLERLVLFSSGSSVLGSPMLGGYAAGNAFLDALARHRRAGGLPATLTNWGFWDKVGMVARQNQAEGRELAPRGMSAFPPRDGLHLLDRLLGEGTGETVEEIVILRADWSQWAAAYPAAATAPLLRELLDPARQRPDDTAFPRRETPPLPRVEAVARNAGHLRITPAAPAPAPPAARPAAATPTVAPAAARVPVPAPAANTRVAVPPAAPDDRIEELVAVQVARVLGQAAERIRRDRPLKQYGLDSLMATELRNLIDREFSVSVPIVDILRGATVRTLAATIRAATATAGDDTAGTAAKDGA
ncbi:acyltransferase domain-containing protein [Streptomyces sp. NPDC051546]|uniref:acyltransferase domain-containing protein n=1 Tax=Streptomyces sp. NPDC051546 TaxID=3365655 RepID=UPI003797B5D4